MRTVLAGDIGGTNARFALATQQGETAYIEEHVLATADFPSTLAAIEHYLHQRNLTSVAGICLAVAGPIEDGKASLTNSHWHFDGDVLREHFNVEHAALLNDFEAIALSIPVVNRDHSQTLGSLRAELKQNYTVCVVGPGTGLGAAGLVCRNNQPYPLVTEAGHMGFAPESDLQRQLLAVLQRQYGRVSAERLVSGMGVENVYSALQSLNNVAHDNLSSADIFNAARNSDPVAVQTVELFFEILGQFTGDLVLATGAYQGAFIAGGVAQRHIDLLATSKFREGFENKGRHSHILRNVPTAVITHQIPGLLGAAAFAVNNFD